MKIRPLDIGVETVTRWRIDDEVHLPTGTGVATSYLPVDRPLDAVLRRPSLDERLPALMQPDFIDPDLLQPAMLAAARRDACARFADAARRQVGRKRDLFQAAADVLRDDAMLDEEVHAALAALMRG